MFEASGRFNFKWTFVPRPAQPLCLPVCQKCPFALYLFLKFPFPESSAAGGVLLLATPQLRSEQLTLAVQFALNIANGLSEKKRKYFVTKCHVGQLGVARVRPVGRGCLPMTMTMTRT